MGQLRQILTLVQAQVLQKGLAFGEFQVSMLRAMDKATRSLLLGILLCMEEYLQMQHDLGNILDNHILKTWQIREWIAEANVVTKDGANLSLMFVESRKRYFQVRKRLFSALADMRQCGSTPAWEARDPYLNRLRQELRDTKAFGVSMMLEAWEAATGTKLTHVAGAGWFWCHGEDWKENLAKLPQLLAIRAFLDSLGEVEGQVKWTRTALSVDDAEGMAEPTESGLTSDEREVRQDWRQAKKDMNPFDIRAWAQRQEDGPFNANLDTGEYAGDSAYDVEFGYGVSGKEMLRVLKDPVRSPTPNKGMEDELIDFTWVCLWTNSLAMPIVSRTFPDGNTITYDDMRAVMSRDVKIGSPTWIQASAIRYVGNDKTAFGQPAVRINEDGVPEFTKSSYWPGKNWWQEIAHVGHSGDMRPNARRSGASLNVFKPKRKRITADWATVYSTRFVDPATFFDWMLYVAYKLASDERVGLDVAATAGYHKKRGKSITGVDAVSNRCYVTLDDYGETWVRYILKTVQIGNYPPFQEAWMVLPVAPLKRHFKFTSKAIEFVGVKLGQVATKQVQHWLRGYKEISGPVLKTLGTTYKTKKAREAQKALRRHLNVHDTVIRDLRGFPEQETYAFPPTPERCFVGPDLVRVSRMLIDAQAFEV